MYFADGTHPSYTAHAASGRIRKSETRDLNSNHGRQNINGASSWPGRQFVIKLVYLPAYAPNLNLITDNFHFIGKRNPQAP